MSHPTEGELGHIAFGVDPVGVASCLHSTSRTDGWILTKLAQTHYLEGERIVKTLVTLTPFSKLHQHFITETSPC